jgi:hydroxyacylglutathione hydrolase
MRSCPNQFNRFPVKSEAVKPRDCNLAANSIVYAIMIERIIVGDLRTNCYFYSFNKKDCLIIDPGGEATRIIAAVEVLNLVPAGIIFTHGHFDHTLAASAIREHYEKKNVKLKIAIHPADRGYLGKNAKRTNLKHFKVLGVEAQVLFEKLFALMPEPDLLLKEGDDVFKSGLKVLETPGHTPGSVCLYCKRESILFTGDTLFFEGIGRSDLPGGSDKALLKSIHEKLLVLPPETNVYPGHGPLTNLERELKGNPYLRN